MEPVKCEDLVWWGFWREATATQLTAANQQEWRQGGLGEAITVPQAVVGGTHGSILEVVQAGPTKELDVGGAR